jgi:predicted RNA-binding Zn ribbon-like protein
MPDLSTTFAGHGITLSVMSLPKWVPPDEAKPAPMPLLLVQAFVNTYEAERDSDTLAEPASARLWLTEASLLDSGESPSSDDLETARSVREAIRGLLRSNSGGPGPTRRQLGLLQSVSADGRLRVEWDAGHRVDLRPESARPMDRALLRLMLIIRDAQVDGTWARLKACSNDDCGWAYYDRSHSQQGRWCDMAVCGNRIKNRALRARQR